MFFIGVSGHSLFVLQIAKIISNRSAHDVSLLGFIAAFISILSWLFYGYLIKDKVLFRVNVVGAFLSCACVVAILLFRS